MNTILTILFLVVMIINNHVMLKAFNETTEEGKI